MYCECVSNANVTQVKHSGEKLGRWPFIANTKILNVRFTGNKQKQRLSDKNMYIETMYMNDIRKRPKRSTESGERLACIDPNRCTVKLLKQRKDDVVTYQFVGLPKHIKN